jgi:hypothetical protein
MQGLHTERWACSTLDEHTARVYSPAAAHAPHKLLSISQLPLESEPRTCTCLTGAGPPAFCSDSSEQTLSG